MTIEEAIKGLKNLFSEHELTLPCTDSLEILHMAVEALEKQMPKKATKIRYFGEAGYYMGLCTSCNEWTNSEYKYCDNCGQKLDWSEEE